MKDCAAIGCTEQIRAAHLMCWNHWSRVPFGLQESVRTALVAWRQGRSGARPYVLAVARAQLAVARKTNQAEEVITHLEQKIAQYEKHPDTQEDQ